MRTNFEAVELKAMNERTDGDAGWGPMHHMRIRANLTFEEHKKILEFLQTN